MELVGFECYLTLSGVGVSTVIDSDDPAHPALLVRNCRSLSLVSFLAADGDGGVRRQQAMDVWRHDEWDSPYPSYPLLVPQILIFDSRSVSFVCCVVQDGTLFSRYTGLYMHRCAVLNTGISYWNRTATGPEHFFTRDQWNQWNQDFIIDQCSSITACGPCVLDNCYIEAPDRVSGIDYLGMGDKFEIHRHQFSSVEEGRIFISMSLSNCLITSENDDRTAICGEKVLSWSRGFLALQNTIVMADVRNFWGCAAFYDNVGEDNLFTGSQLGFYDNLTFHDCNIVAHFPPPVIKAIEHLEELHFDSEVDPICAWSRWLIQHMLGSRNMVPAGYIEFVVRTHHTFANIYVHTCLSSPTNTRKGVRIHVTCYAEAISRRHLC